MGRSAGFIATEIAALEADITNLVQSAASDGTSLQKTDYAAKCARLDKLYLMQDRATGAAPMLVRGVVKGMG